MAVKYSKGGDTPKTDWLNKEEKEEPEEISTIKTLLQRQVDHEFGNESLYLSMAIWCDINEYYETAKFFSKHTLEERRHGYDFLNFMLSQEMKPKPPELEKVQSNFENMKDLLEAALTREKLTSKLIGEIHTMALKGGNLALTIAGKYLNEQTEEEQLFTALLNLYNTTNGNKADFELMVPDIKKRNKFKPGLL